MTCIQCSKFIRDLRNGASWVPNTGGRFICNECWMANFRARHQQPVIHEEQINESTGKLP